MEFSITSDQILAFCAFVTSIWVVSQLIKEIKKPSDGLKLKVETHERLLDNDNRRLNEIEQSNKLILQSLLVIVNHEISGNGIEAMKKQRDELQDYLVNRQKKWHVRQKGKRKKGQRKESDKYDEWY